MGCILTLIDSILAFIRRNPLTVLLIVVLAVGAPALMRGVVAFIFYFIFGVILLGLILSLVLRWRILKMQSQMGGQFSQSQGGARGPGGYGRSRQSRTDAEGEVRVHVTDEIPEKRIAEDVGDYVDFEETR